MSRVIGWTSLAPALMFSSALCALLLGLKRFKGLVRREVEALLARATTAPEEAVVTEEMLE